MTYRRSALKEIVSFWGIDLKDLHPEARVEGSPERTEFRTVVEDHQRKYYLLERIPEHKLDLKLKIIDALNHLFTQGLSRVIPYLPKSDGKYIHDYHGGLWQMLPYLVSVPLDREKYIFDQWRGKAMADFLADLRRSASNVPQLNRKDVFSIKDFILNFAGRLQRHNPELLSRVNPILKGLESSFFEIHDHLPTAFCHGDYHPLNIIWAPQDIQAVIDWEFLGYKLELYDAANLIGCIGMEDPEALTGDFIREFLSRLRAASIMSELSWKYLFEFILAVRFAWLSEWLRKSDQEMVEMELDYLDLLLGRGDELKERWGLISRV